MTKHDTLLHHNISQHFFPQNVNKVLTSVNILLGDLCNDFNILSFSAIYKFLKQIINHNVFIEV
jgi:hypothetical protein